MAVQASKQIRPLANTAARRNRPSTTLLLAYMLIGIGAVFCVFPFYMMLVYGTQSKAEIFSFPPPLWFGDDFIANLLSLLSQVPFWRNIWNTLYIALLHTGFTLFFCSLAGYAFAMYEFRGREFLFSIVLGTMLIPGFVNMVPSYLMLNFFGWLNQPIALWLPGVAGAFGIFFMRQYIGSTVPKELLEAARIDGCSEFGAFWRVILPLARPALGTLGLITFIGAWNNLQGALIVMSSKETYTVQLALNNLKGAYNTDWGANFAGALIAVIPLTMLLIVFSRQLIEGLMAGSVKG
jgi:multiple sugar transport system permease protein